MAAKTSKRYWSLLWVCAALAILLSLIWLAPHLDLAVLNPHGPIAAKERHLIIFSSLLMLLVVIPVFIMTFVIVWRYRASNTNARYTPDWDHNSAAETAWWLVPLALITVLSVLAWQSSHELDPFKVVSVAGKKPLTIQVVALQWKWLFIYPKQQVATVNYFAVPVGTPINFQVTADAPMNSFWIPKLGGQIYAMAGMDTQLHLLASSPGKYGGSSANISGAGFAQMRFTAEAMPQINYDRWMQNVQTHSKPFGVEAYAKLETPGDDDAHTPTAAYRLTEPNLYNEIIMSFMMPGHQLRSTTTRGIVDDMPASHHGGMLP